MTLSKVTSADAPIQVRRALTLLWASVLIGALVTATDYELWTTTEIPEIQEMPEMRWIFWLWFPTVYAFFFALIYFISKRKNWARMVFAVIELIAIALIGWVWLEGNESVITWGEAGLMTMDLVALYWLFTGAGARWFKERPA